MAERKNINDIIQQALDNLSPEFIGMRDELKKFMRANLESILQRMDLVSREEYDIQVQLLERLRHRIADLEQKIQGKEEGSE
ncbi:MAG: accessory factor UbiK family protein [Candidatus Oxydemutatoraceae bacterium WSBS_2016_MAG_OTU14]